jgi:hypothetical protein
MITVKPGETITIEPGAGPSLCGLPNLICQLSWTTLHTCTA